MRTPIGMAWFGAHRHPSGVRPLRRGIAVAVLAVVLAACGWAAEPTPSSNNVPKIHISWRAPFGDPRALDAVTVTASDTTRVDTLFLTFETSRPGFPLQSLAGALLFEPRPQDSLGSFWSFERGAGNAGNLRIVFDTILSEYCQYAWFQLVTAHVGYTRVGQRGRLDFSAEVPQLKARNLVANTSYCFARIEVDHRLCRELTGHTQPLRISWVGTRFLSASNKVMRPLPGPGQSVTWNARGRGVVTRRPISTLVWIPRSAPPSWSALPGSQASQNRAVGDTTFKAQ